MQLNKQQIAARINRYARLRAQIAALENRAMSDAAVLKTVGGGESSKWRAALVTMPRRTMVIKRHKQLRLYAKGDK